MLIRGRSKYEMMFTNLTVKNCEKVTEVEWVSPLGGAACLNTRMPRLAYQLQEEYCQNISSLGVTSRYFT